MQSTSNIKKELLRKSLHMLFATILLIPFINQSLIPALKLNVLEYYVLLTLITAYINALQIKRPLIRKELKSTWRNTRKRIIDEVLNIKIIEKVPIGSFLRNSIRGIEEKIERLEDLVDNHIDLVEREYEKRGGYIGITFGALSVTLSYILFRKYLFYGILAILFFDPIASIVGEFYGRHKLPYTNATIEGSLAGFFSYLFVLFLLEKNPLKILILASSVLVGEAYGIEDNLTIPFVGSLIAFIVAI